MKIFFSFLLFSMLLSCTFADEIFPRKGFDGFPPDGFDRGERGNAHGPEINFRNIKFEYTEGDKLFKNTDEAKEYQTLYDKNKDSKEIKDFFESLEKKMKVKMQTMMKSGERPDMAKMKIEREENQKQLLKEMKGILEKKKNTALISCAGSSQSKIIEKPAIDSMNDAKNATSIVMTLEELAKLKTEIKEEVKKEIMKDMPNKMADRDDRRHPLGGQSDDKDSPFADSSSRLKKGKRPSQQSGGDNFLAGDMNSNMNSIGMVQNKQMQQGQQGQTQSSQYQQQIMAQIQVPQMSYSQQLQMPQYYSGQNFSMSNGIGMRRYSNANNFGHSSHYNIYSQYGGNYQSLKNYRQNSMQQNPYMNVGNISNNSPNSAYLQYGSKYLVQPYYGQSMQQHPFAMMGQ